ncbi:MAG TPA: FAD-binding protein [Candidatus Limnocylindrales bacterium]
MARADVAVVGVGLAGMTAAISLAQAGARVQVLASGHAATHWSAGGVDAGALVGATTSHAAVEQLARQAGHPYALVADELPGALAWVRTILAIEGLTLVGELDDPLRPIPTAIGSTRRAAIVPDGAAGALPAWRPDETLFVCGPAGFKDFWPEAIAAGLRRAEAWRGEPGPGRIEALSVELPGLRTRRNLSGLDLARRFDQPAWRSEALGVIAAAVVERQRRLAGSSSAARIALPAVLGLADHPAALAEARARLPALSFEVALVPPSVPGLRLFEALRAALRRHGGRLIVGEAVHGSIGPGGHLAEIRSPAAARELVVSAGAFILATGGIAGGGIWATGPDSLIETVLGLPVEVPGDRPWLADDPFDPAGHPLELAGIRTDAQLRPVEPGTGPGGSPLAVNVRIAGSALAGQRYLRERCGDGVALASGRRAADGSWPQ